MSSAPAITRRKFHRLLTAAGGAPLLAKSVDATDAPSTKSPFRLLYNSDTTHILSCTSAWRPTREPLRESMFVSAVDEALDAGADAFLIAPGLGWVPWWPSQVLPLAQHCEWFKQRFNLPKASTSFTNYVLQGGDFLKLTVDRCHEKGAACLASFRMNDVHHKESADTPGNSHVASVPQFYTDHPVYRLGGQPRATQMSWGRYVHNWALPEVREFKFRVIEELCRNYDLDGIELDFYRAAAYFRFQETTRAQRSGIMAEFVTRVRRALDDHARPGRRRWLSVRIPSQLAAHDALGIDVAAFAAAGVDMFNLSASYHT
ncbi:MAG TPA: family 10 glycosylhydrolase, partial [Verrucomicrobium sp.]|nr:family 10 glycosylhydrolase [Verrucomicrobium sp.]